MRNKELIQKVKELATKPLYTRDQSSRIMVQIAIIRQAFGVKNNEHENIIRDYERERILSDDDIRKEFEKYLGFLDWSIEIGDAIKKREFFNNTISFIDAVEFFSQDLSDEFNKRISGYLA